MQQGFASYRSLLCMHLHARKDRLRNDRRCQPDVGFNKHNIDNSQTLSKSGNDMV